MRFFPFFASLLLLFFHTPGWAQSVAGPEAPTAGQGEIQGKQKPATLHRVRFESMARFQVEVWIDGKRAGFTPFLVRLPEGEYIMTATAESLAPIVQTIEVDEDSEVVWIPPVPVTRNNYQGITREVVRHIVEHPDNPHLLIASLLMAIDPSDKRDLLRRADQAIPGDPMVDVIRADYFLKLERKDEALVAAQRALESLGMVGFAWRRLAEVHLAREEHAEALEAINQAVLLDPRGWRNLRVRSRVHQAMGNSNAGAIDAERAEELYAVPNRIVEGLNQ